MPITRSFLSAPAPATSSAIRLIPSPGPEFAQAEFDVVKDLTLTAGARWSTEEKTFDYNYVAQSTGFKGGPDIPAPYFQRDIPDPGSGETIA